MADDVENRPIFRQMNLEFLRFLERNRDGGSYWASRSEIKAISQIDARLGYLLDRRDEIYNDIRRYLEEAYYKPYEGK